MKALFISFNQAYNQEITEILENHGQRGFTRWDDVTGRGSSTGIPHFGTHAWPELNAAVMAVVEDDCVAAVLADLKAKDEESQSLGLRVFTWNIEQSV